MILYINSTAHENVTFMLNTDGKTITKTFIIGSHSGHKIVKKLEEFLKSKIKDERFKIQEIVVNSGPGSFVGTRVGVTIAQALAMVWNVPVKYLENEEFQKVA
jgi:tRNA A37 threonylcarbamoyladenosine modification protein TsaB